MNHATENSAHAHSRVPLSVVLITLNAGAQLEACLESVAGWVDEILLVDSGSHDETRAIADRYGARWIEQDWLGFGPQKQFAVEQARHDWVLCLDADERVSPQLQESLVAILKSPPSCPAYRFPRCNRFLGRYLRYGEGYPDLSLRLFDRRQARWSADAVHEKVIVQGVAGSDKVGLLSGDLIHDSAETLAHYLTKQNRYTSLAAQEALARGKRVSGIRLVLSPLLRFVKFYGLRQGFRDGVPGLIHVAIGCFNSFMKYAKMIEGRQGRDQ